ncbi:hypothetical protein [Candidatus Electronema sp. PJ]|uniref:hypothetical protein n=1 Tax=Candidatus Electronema sp. PJ TaxID=3401572 RepID=UPI003AA8884F
MTKRSSIKIVRITTGWPEWNLNAALLLGRPIVTVPVRRLAKDLVKAPGHAPMNARQNTVSATRAAAEPSPAGKFALVMTVVTEAVSATDLFSAEHHRRLWQEVLVRAFVVALSARFRAFFFFKNRPVAYVKTSIAASRQQIAVEKEPLAFLVVFT